MAWVSSSSGTPHDARTTSDEQRRRCGHATRHVGSPAGSSTTKRAAAERIVSTCTRPAVGSHVLGDEREPEPGALDGLLPRAGPAPEAAEDPLAVGGRDARPVVLDGQDEDVVDARDVDVARCARRGSARVVLGVVEEVHEHPFDAPAIEAHDRIEARCDVELDAVVSRRAPSARARRRRPCRPRAPLRRRRCARSRAGRARVARSSGSASRARRPRAACAGEGRLRARAPPGPRSLNAVSGVRSSWLTSDAKRASRSMRCCSETAISLNDRTMGSRSASPSSSSRVSRRPPAMSTAAADTRSSGRSSRRLAYKPTAAPAMAVNAGRDGQRAREDPQLCARGSRAARTRSTRLRRRD